MTKAKNPKPIVPSNDPSATRGLLSQDALLLREGEKIVHALGKMLAPSCEVVLHDLGKPEHAILAIENPLSGRAVGEPTTEMGLARIRDPDFPDVVQNYSNTLPDGRPVKSTSIGLRNAEGICIAAICVNFDLSLYETVQRVLEQFCRIDTSVTPVRESFRAKSLGEVRQAVLDFATRQNIQPRAMAMRQRRQLVRFLSEEGLLQMRGATGIVAEVIGVARSSIYNDIKANE